MLLCQDKKTHKARVQKAVGFTLVELLIVITIIGVLAGVLLVVINPASILAKGRDVQRLSDMDNLYKALTLALVDEEITLSNQTSCTGCDSISGSFEADGTGWIKFDVPVGKVGLKKVLSRLPLDPINATQNSVTYKYVYSSDTSGFELNTVLESADNLTKMAVDGGNNTQVYELGTDVDLNLL